MTDCLIVGMPNAGKTCFVINFAAFLGAGKIKIYRKRKAGYAAAQTFSLNEARKTLISKEENTTREIQAIMIKIPAGKTNKELKMVDTCGLKNSTSNRELRLKMAATIKELQKHELIIHITDLQKLNFGKEKFLPPVDRMIKDFSCEDKIYFLLANKIDLSGAEEKFRELVKYTDIQYIFPVSALHQKGFDDVKNHLLNFL